MATVSTKDPKRLVKVKIPRNPAQPNLRSKYVCVNNHSYLIQLGKEVEVPYYIAEVLERSVRDEELALERREALQSGEWTSKI